MKEETVQKVERFCNHIITRGLGVALTVAAGAGVYLELLNQWLGAGLIVLGLAMVAPTRLEKAASVLGKVMSKLKR